MTNLDYLIITFINQFARQSWTFDTTVVFITSSNLLKGGVLVMAFWWAWFRGAGESLARNRRVVLNTIFSGFLAIFTARALAICLPFRLRPLSNPDLDFVYPFSLKATRLTGWSAFPSDHAALFFALATGMFFVSRTWGILALFHVLFLICLPRIYTGLHYPTDIYAGAIIGVIAGIFANRSSAVRDHIDARVLAWSSRHRAAFYASFFLLSYQVATLFEDVRELAGFGFETVRNLGRLIAERH